MLGKERKVFVIIASTFSMFLLSESSQSQDQGAKSKGDSSAQREAESGVWRTPLRAFFKKPGDIDCFEIGGAINFDSKGAVEMMFAPVKTQPIIVDGAHDPFGQPGAWAWTFSDHKCSIKLKFTKEIYIENSWQTIDMLPGTDPRSMSILPTLSEKYDNFTRKSDTIALFRLADRNERPDYVCPDADGFFAFTGNGLQILLNIPPDKSNREPFRIDRTVSDSNRRYSFILDAGKCRSIIEISEQVDVDNRPIQLQAIPDGM